MNEKELGQQLQQMQSLKASDTLHHKIDSLTHDLLPRRKGMYFPLVTFRLGLVLAVLLLVLGLGTGVVAAARLTKPGMPFYQVKHAIEQLPLPVFHNENKSASQPSTQPTPSSKEKTEKEKSSTPQLDKNKTDNKGKDHSSKSIQSEVENFSTLPTKVPEEDVKGLHIGKDTLPVIPSESDSSKSDN